MCYRGNTACTYDGDEDHACSPHATTEQEQRLGRVMQVISLAHERGWESVTLNKREIAALAEHHHLMRVGDYAVLYETRRHNPLFSRDVAERRAGAEVCKRCDGAITPSNRAIHETGNCWPRWTA